MAPEFGEPARGGISLSNARAIKLTARLRLLSRRCPWSRNGATHSGKETARGAVKRSSVCPGNNGSFVIRCCPSRAIPGNVRGGVDRVYDTRFTRRTHGLRARTHYVRSIPPSRLKFNSTARTRALPLVRTVTWLFEAATPVFSGTLAMEMNRAFISGLVGFGDVWMFP